MTDLITDLQNATTGTRELDARLWCEIDQANARLIAAAPELLEALEAIASLEEKTRASADPDDWESNWDLLQETFATSSAAIAKAKGEKL